MMCSSSGTCSATWYFEHGSCTQNVAYAIAQTELIAPNVNIKYFLELSKCWNPQQRIPEITLVLCMKFPTVIHLETSLPSAGGSMTIISALSLKEFSNCSSVSSSVIFEPFAAPFMTTYFGLPPGLKHEINSGIKVPEIHLS